MTSTDTAGQVEAREVIARIVMTAGEVGWQPALNAAGRILAALPADRLACGGGEASPTIDTTRAPHDGGPIPAPATQAAGGGVDKAIDRLRRVGLGDAYQVVYEDFSRPHETYRGDINAVLNALATLSPASKVQTAGDAIEAAFIAGFKASGEGWNGEYPFEGVPDADPEWQHVRDRATEYQAALQGKTQ